MAGTAGSGSSLDVDGRTVALTNLDRVMYPETGTTKAEVLRYYLSVANVMLPHLRGRAVTRHRWPDGTGAEGFFEKNLPTWAPDWLPTALLEHSDRTVRYPVPGSRADLLWMAQAGALELHTPQWRVGPKGERLGPDRLVLDLDPGAPAGLAECAELALWLRARLTKDGATAFPVTSGSKGMQVYAAWPVPASTSDSPVTYARDLAMHLAATFPDRVVATMTRADRTGRVYVDWSQNNPAKTTIAPYSLRGRAQPTVAAPRSWDEVEATGLRQLTYDEVLTRVDQAPDPMARLDGPNT